MKCGFSIGYGIGRKYQPMWVSISVSDQNQNSGFGLTLSEDGRVSGKGGKKPDKKMILSLTVNN